MHMFTTPEKQKALGKWVIGVITICILIYLVFRHIGSIVGVVSSLLSLFKPLLIGCILAMILNVPMRPIERFLQTKLKLKKGTRPLAILLSLLLVCGVFVGVGLLVIPELIKAIMLLVQIAGNGLDQLAEIKTGTAADSAALTNFLAGLDIDWLAWKTQLEEWVMAQGSLIVNQVVGAAGSFVRVLVSFCVGVVFGIYILAGKETLKRQVCRLIRAWLPARFGESVIHVCAVCSNIFRLFITGQATEAMILGSLCALGMAILRIPYAAMVGALIGVTALIPIVGAFVGTIVGAVMILTVNPLKAVVFVVFLLILQQIEGNMIYPRVVGAKISLPAMWVLAAVTVGGNIGGPLGMLLGVPAASAAYALLREATEKREEQQAKIAFPAETTSKTEAAPEPAAHT